MRRSLVWLLAFLALGSASALAGPASVDLLTVGAAIRASHGMIFDRQNRLYVASVLGRSITVLDPDSGVILARIGPEQGVETPDDVAFTPDGALYWTAIVPGEIGKLSARGEFSHQFVAFSLNSVATSQGGRVFASQCAFQGGSGLFELDPALLAPPRLITDALGEACGLNGMAVGPDGLLYGPRSANGDVVRVNPESGAFSVVATGFAVPSAVKFDSRGRLWVTDLGAGTLDRVDPQTGQKTRIVTLAPGLDSLAIDRRDRVFVSSNVTGEVAEVKSDGSVRVVRHGGLTAPGGLALLPRADGESLFVADLSGLEELDSASGAVRSIAGATFRAAIQDPITVARDGANLILSSWSAGNVQVWDPRTQTVLEDHAGQLGLPRPLADDIALAAFLHDAGKAHPAFKRM
nr:SMP-30/gluconolactonase/LRE family protein [Thermoanaerobaculia bacterium]